MKNEFEADRVIDITDVICPLTYVKVKIELEGMESGQILRVHMNEGEPVSNLPRSIKNEGNRVLKLYDNYDGTFELIVKKI